MTYRGGRRQRQRRKKRRQRDKRSMRAFARMLLLGVTMPTRAWFSLDVTNWDEQ